MCLIVFAYKTHPDYKLILVANRDEFYHRPTLEAHWWEDPPGILAGKDLKAKGTWMGIRKNGRFSAVTNYRDISNIREEARSRGDLPLNFLKGNQKTTDHAKTIKDYAHEYNGFNLLLFDESMVHFSNYEGRINELKPGIYGLSNALLDTPWPKVTKAKQIFEKSITHGFIPTELLNTLDDTEVAADQDLPDTGLSPEMEKALSPMCIRTPNYGTCCSTVVTISHSDMVTFVERTYPVGERQSGTREFTFPIH